MFVCSRNPVTGPVIVVMMMVRNVKKNVIKTIREKTSSSLINQLTAPREYLFGACDMTYNNNSNNNDEDDDNDDYNNNIMT